MTEQELDELEEKNTATVGQLIAYLKKNFNSDDLVCYMDCVEGVRNDCTYVKKSELGKRFLYYVSELKQRCKKDGLCGDDDFPYVKDNDVVLI